MTKTADLGMPEINEIVSKVNTTALSGAMQANYSLPDNQNLAVHMVFYHQKYIGALELKNENTLTTDQYVQEWKTTHNTGNHILFLFTWNESNNLYEHKKLDVSPAMETNHLFTEVMNFIRANLSGSSADIVEKGTRYLANAIRPVWDKDDVKKGEAVGLVGEDRYKANRINYFHNEWSSTFLDIEPLCNTSTHHIKVFFKYASSSDTLKPAISIYADENVFTEGLDIIEGYEYAFEIFGKRFFSYTLQEYVLLIEIFPNTFTNHEAYIIPLVEAVLESNKYSDQLKVSQWNWSKTNNPVSFSLNSMEGLSNINNEDKFVLTKRDMNSEFPEGDPIPVIHPWHPRTFCNVYASDLARDILFPGVFSGGSGSSTYAPWGPHDRASYLHDAMADSDKFFPLKNGEDTKGFVDAWKFTNAGYVVYLSAYNRRYYANPPGNIHPGHIVTCYPTRPNEIELRNWKDALIIQAGGSTNKTAIDNAWINPNFSNGEERGDRQKVHAHLYLGYILKTN